MQIFEMAAFSQLSTKLPASTFCQAIHGRPSVRIAKSRDGLHALKAHNIAVLPGDGIGPEIAEVAVELLKAAGKLEGEEFVFEEALIGGAAIDAVGKPLPEETLSTCIRSEAVLLAAIGGCVDIFDSPSDNSAGLFRPKAVGSRSESAIGGVQP